MLQDELTILVCSCDMYADLWDPFFTLLRKYWNPLGVRILLNTESLDFSFNGLNIECIHSPNETQYGKRMLNVLSKVETKYVLLMLDDFFLRSPVQESKISEIIQWMENDAGIAYFNCDPNVVYADWEVDKYPGFRRIPPGNQYTFSMQAAIWRTDILKRSWLPDVSPWEWESLTNARSYRWRKKKFYCVHDSKAAFLDYGHYRYGDVWGVYRGKWYIDDIKPLFEREKIHIDFSKRGIITSKQETRRIPTDGWGTYEHIGRCLGQDEVIRYKIFNRYCQLLSLLHRPVNWNYFEFLQEKAKKRFLRKHRFS